MNDSRYEPAPQTTVRHPDWAKNATIYQINTRHFTPEGTFRAAIAHLPRLAELGVSILWLMPVHEIGEVNRKGRLGSPYAVKDYYSVSAELGTPQDLRDFVDAAHAQGFKVILDWVANHTAWDNVLVEQHPEWYARDWKGDFCPTPWWDWDDIIDLDYDQPGLRRYMTEALVHWVREYDLDGYRCDVAGMVPTDFWAQARRELDAVKPVFMLAEWEARDLHDDAFDMTYAWSWNDALHKLAHGREDLTGLRVYYAWDAKAYQRDSIRMLFTSNHDKNAWEGTEYELFGDAVEAAIVLTFASKGMPLIHNGQEAGLRRRLAFFDKDEIEWREDPMRAFYQRLVALRRDTSALWSGTAGAPMVPLATDADEHVIAFVREDDDSRVLMVANLSPQARAVSLRSTIAEGDYTSFADGAALTVAVNRPLELPAWGWLLGIAPGRGQEPDPELP